MISHLIYIGIMHKTMWFHLAKGEEKSKGPWASCLLYFITRHSVIFNQSDEKHIAIMEKSVNGVLAYVGRISLNIKSNQKRII